MVSAYYPAWVAALLRYQLVDPAHSTTIFWLGLAILRSRLCRLAAACTQDTELSDRSHLNPGRFQFHASGSVPGEPPAAVPLSRQFLQRNRFASSVAVPGTPVTARLRLSAVVFATHMANMSIWLPHSPRAELRARFPALLWSPSLAARLRPSHFASSVVVHASPFLERRSQLVSVGALLFSPLRWLSCLFRVASLGGGA